MEEKKHSLKDWNLNGKVKSIVSQTFEPAYENGEIKLGDSIKYPWVSEWIPYTNNFQANFNELGFITEHSMGTWDDNYVFKYLYQNNNLQKMETIRKLRQSPDYYIKTKKSSQQYEYKNGKLIKIIYKDSENKIESSSEIKTNNQGQIISEFRYNDNGGFIYSAENEYDGEQLKISSQLDSLGKELSKVIYTYYSNGDKKKLEEYNDNKLSKTIKYEYDEFDDNKNWSRAKIIHSKNDSVSYIVTRDINYFIDKNKSSYKISERELIGIWQEVESKQWMEFKANQKYDIGKNEYIYDNGTFELNQDSNILTFISTKESKSKKYKLEYRNNKIHLFTINGNVKEVYEKK